MTAHFFGTDIRLYFTLHSMLVVASYNTTVKDNALLSYCSLIVSVNE